MYEDIYDDSVKVDIKNLPDFFYIIKDMGSEDPIPTFVFTEFHKFLDLMTSIINDGTQPHEVDFAKMPIKDKLFVSKTSFLKEFLNREIKSNLEHTMLFGDKIKVSDNKSASELKDLERKIFS